MDELFVKVLLAALQMLVGGFCVVLWVNFQDMKQKADRLSAALEAHKLHVAETYVTQNVLTKAIEGLAEALKQLGASMERRLDNIERKLDSKQDKA